MCQDSVISTVWTTDQILVGA